MWAGRRCSQGPSQGQIEEGGKSAYPVFPCGLLVTLPCPHRFVYEEEQGAEAFFVPYLWSLVTNLGGPWNLRNAELLAGGRLQ